MTALCAGGGTSSTKPGVVDDLIYGTGFLGLIQLAPGLEWLIPFIPLLGNLAYHTPDLCATDPPGFPTFSAGDAIALAIADPGPAGHAARQKVLDTLTTLAWYSLCECDAGAQPSIPAAPSAPVTPTLYAPANPAVGPCYSVDMVIAAGGLSPSGSPFHQGTLAGPTTIQIPSGISGVRVAPTIVNAGAGPHSGHTNVSLHLFNSAFGLIQQIDLDHTGQGTYHQDGIVISGVAYFSLIGLSFFSGNTDSATCHIDFYCGGASPGASETSCPSDPLTLAILQQILDMVTLVQRQSVPFAYIPETVHSGLTGSGEITISALIGAKIVITDTIPNTIGAEAGDPEENFGLGWIVWGNSDGWTSRQFLGHVDNISLPNEAGVFTTLGYSLAPGVVATITELRRER